ncbi:MAG: LEPR-XLL domain-containing protein [Phycisphaeraceae bacterium]
MVGDGYDLPLFEPLEPRLLLSASPLVDELYRLSDGVIGNDPVVNVSVEQAATTANDFVRLNPLGALISVSKGNTGLIGSDPNGQGFEFFAEAGQTISAVASPDDPSVTLSVELPGVSGLFFAPGPGEPAVLPATAIASDGLYEVRVKGDGVSTFTLDIYYNAALEAQVGDSDDGNELPIDNSFIGLGSGRFAVVGSSDIAIPTSGDLVYVASRDAGGVGGMVEVYSENGTVQGIIDDPIFDTGVLSDVELGPTGNIFVSLDLGNNGINGGLVEFAPDGTFLNFIPVPNDTGVAGLLYPVGFEVLADGTFLVPKPNSQTIQHLSSSGALIGQSSVIGFSPVDVAVNDTAIIFTDVNSGTQQFVNIAADEFGWMAILDNNDSELFDPNLNFTGDTRPGNGPVDPQEADDLSLFITNAGNNTLRKFNAAGSQLFSVPTIGQPVGLAVATGEVLRPIPFALGAASANLISLKHKQEPTGDGPGAKIPPTASNPLVLLTPVKKAKQELTDGPIQSVVAGPVALAPASADIDEYTLDLTGKAGRSIDVILAGQDGTDFSNELLELLDVDGTTVLATTAPDPLGVVAANYDLAVLSFLVPADGVYTLRLSAQVKGNYAMIVTDSLTFDTEPNDDPTVPLRSLNDTDTALGYLGDELGPGVNRVVDGGFELGPFGGAWNEFSTNFGTPICDLSCGTGNGTGPHSGNFWAWFGGVFLATEVASVDQDIVFPTGTATLTFFFEIPAASGTNIDFFNVKIDGTPVFSANDLSVFLYTQIVLDVSSFADGATHNLSFGATTEGFGVTNFFVDDVELYAGPFVPNAEVDRATPLPLDAPPEDAARRVPNEANAAAQSIQPHPAALTAFLPIGVTTADLAAQLVAAPPPNPAAPLAGEGLTSLTSVTEETEPNNSIGTANPVPLGFDAGEDTAVDITGNISGGDLDFFRVELDAGDIIGANVSSGATTLSFQNSSGFELMGSNQDATFIHPTVSPLPGGGNAALSWVVDTPDTYYVRVSGGSGAYTLNLRVFRPVLEAEPVGTEQVLFLDFDGAAIDTSIFGAIGIANLSPLSSFMPGWGLDPVVDLDAVIDAIVGTVEETLSTDLRLFGNNGDFDASGIPGQFDIDILNSRDDADPFGQPNVSRVIIGGSIAELGISTLGIAQTIDVGNFDTAETAVVLLDLLSGPSGGDSINTIPRAGGVPIVPVIGEVVGNITAHEAGHFFANWHTDNSNVTPNIMDRGGNGVLDDAGVGPDGVFGTSDDIDVDFGDDLFTPVEGFTGVEDTLNSIAFGLSTGTLDPALIGPTVVSINPPAGTTNDLNITDITIEFSELISSFSALDPTNYLLLEAGSNAIFEGGAGDDVTIPFAPSFDGSTIVDLLIDPGFAPLVPGMYQLTLDGSTEGGSIEDLDGNPLNSTTGPGGGFDEVHQFDVVFDVEPGGDLYLIDLTAGQSVSINTLTLFDNPAATPLNDLDPKLVVIGPNGLPIAGDEDSFDGRNAQVVLTAPLTGSYTIQTLAQSGFGEYLLNVNILLPGDFDNDGDVDADDIDLLTTNFGNAAFDLDGDNDADADDLTFMVETILGTAFGDADLNRIVGFADFTVMQNNFGLAGGWANANFNGDALVTFADFSILQNNFGFDNSGGGAPASAIASITQRSDPLPTTIATAGESDPANKADLSRTQPDSDDRRTDKPRRRVRLTGQNNQPMRLSKEQQMVAVLAASLNIVTATGSIPSFGRSAKAHDGGIGATAARILNQSESLMPIAKLNESA